MWISPRPPLFCSTKRDRELDPFDLEGADLIFVAPSWYIMGYVTINFIRSTAPIPNYWKKKRKTNRFYIMAWLFLARGVRYKSEIGQWKFYFAFSVIRCDRKIDFVSFFRSCAINNPSRHILGIPFKIRERFEIFQNFEKIYQIIISFKKVIDLIQIKNLKQFTRNFKSFMHL